MLVLKGCLSSMRRCGKCRPLKCQHRAFISYLKRKGYWKNFLKIVHFTIHFLSVMVLLYFGAMIFAILEDPELYAVISTERVSDHDNTTSNRSHTIKEVQNFWAQLEKDYDVHCTNHTRDILMEEIYEFVLRGVRQRVQISALEASGNKPDHDDDAMVKSEVQSLVSQSNFTGHSDREILVFWQNIEKKYNITVNGHRYIDVLHDLKKLIDKGLKHHIHTSSTVFLKWFYFVTTTVTTIGYGQVSPQTENGRLFYIFFSVLGVALMMTLLKSLGDILSEANRRLYSFLKRGYLERFFTKISDQLLSFVSLILMFVIYMAFVVWHDKGMEGAKSRTLITELYYWVVTFTTVGFGDVTYPLEVEIHHLWDLLFYRLLGLTFLAAIIDALQQYVKYRKKIIVKSTKQGMRKVSQMMVRLTKDVLVGSLQPEMAEQVQVEGKPRRKTYVYKGVKD